MVLEGLQKSYSELELDLDGRCKKILDNWDAKKAAYSADQFIYKVRNKEIKVPTHTTSLSHLKIPAHTSGGR